MRDSGSLRSLVEFYSLTENWSSATGLASHTAATDSAFIRNLAGAAQHRKNTVDLDIAEVRVKNHLASIRVFSLHPSRSESCLMATGGAVFVCRHS
jgi:hypothetical protein